MNANVTKIVPKLVANLVAKYDANLVQSPRSRQVPILPVTHFRPISRNHFDKYPATERKDVTHQKAIDLKE
ncbi:hypothetical protein TNCV_4551141 [Trichonephila clavipes]|uniref:Uncharacterized protein n=1 Tax=Trichonephila clavipes TaxID=2585209 RepID=A0A8X6S6I0_TRICX|nr:hypothetical protein TNCV_4551141 [Trichonephila clavipes]